MPRWQIVIVVADYAIHRYYMKKLFLSCSRRFKARINSRKLGEVPKTMLQVVMALFT